MSLASRAVRITLLSSILVFMPAAALAQEAQPFTNTSDEGWRVGPAVSDSGVRLDGEAATATMQVHSGPASGTTTIGAPTTILHGRVAASIAAGRSVTAFGSVFSSYTSFRFTDAVKADVSRFTDQNPYHNWGDVTLGARWHDALDEGSSVHYAVEGGAMFFGATGGFLGSAPDFSATSPFTRGLVTFAPGNFRINGNLGVSYDRSWALWKATYDANKSTASGRSVSEIYPEDRLILGVYGSQPLVRVLGGVSASFSIGAARPFVETSFEETGGSLVARVSPGIVFTPAGLPHILLGADIVPQRGEPDAGPREPSVAVHAALAWGFGARARDGTRTPTTRPSRPGRRTFFIEVLNEENKPVQGARLVLDGRPGSTTGPDGRAEQEDTGVPISMVRANAPGYFILPLRMKPGSPAAGERFKMLAVPAGSLENISITFCDEHGTELATPQLKASLGWTGGRMWERRIPNPYHEEQLPASPDKKWELTISSANGSSAATWSMELNQPGASVNKRIFWDAAGSRWTETVPLARPTATATPDPGTVQLPALFDADLAEVKPSAPGLSTVLERLKDPATHAQIVVVVHGAGGDTSFAEALGRARAEAFVAFLKGRGVLSSQIVSPSRVEFNHNEPESVRVEFPK